MLPKRLWVDVTRSGGALEIAVVITDIKIGTKSMLAGVEPIPASQFASNAFAQSYSIFEAAIPGIDITLSFALSAVPAAGQSVTVSASFDCETIG